MSASTGSCLCGNVKISFSGEPAMHALCHCADCRKISGAPFSNNIVISNDGFKVESGSPKTFTKTADSGKKITSYFCGDCGTTLYRQGESFGPQTIIKAGCLDDKKWADKTPAAELFAPDRVAWETEVKGAKQITKMGA